jgi:hypothetical protein
MSTTFAEKTLELTITLGEGDFGATAGPTVTLSGLRMRAELVNPGGDSMGMLQIRVWGMDPKMMNRLTTIGQVNRAIRTKNSVLLAAGDVDGALHGVFQGTIFDAWADYNSAPEVAFNVVAYAGLDLAVTPASALSFNGPADVAMIMQNIATKAGLAFENNGVQVQLSNPYLPGTPLAQIRACARAANIRHTIDRGVLAIWPKDGNRTGSVPVISSDTGMVGYPALSSKGMTVTTLFNPEIALGADVQIQSEIPMACGKFRVFNVSHMLACRMPDGPWFSRLDCYNVA